MNNCSRVPGPSTTPQGTVKAPLAQRTSIADAGGYKHLPFIFQRRMPPTPSHKLFATAKSFDGSADLANELR